MSRVMAHINDHEADPYMEAFAKRLEEGSPAPIDRANASVERASQALSIFSEDASASEKALLKEALDRSIKAANLTAKAEAAEEEALAVLFAEKAEEEALSLDSFDQVKLDGLHRVYPLEEVRRAKLQ